MKNKRGNTLLFTKKRNNLHVDTRLILLVCGFMFLKFTFLIGWIFFCCQLVLSKHTTPCSISRPRVRFPVCFLVIDKQAGKCQEILAGGGWRDLVCLEFYFPEICYT